MQLRKFLYSENFTKRIKNTKSPRIADSEILLLCFAKWQFSYRLFDGRDPDLHEPQVSPIAPAQSNHTRRKRRPKSSGTVCAGAIILHASQSESGVFANQRQICITETD